MSVYDISAEKLGGCFDLVFLFGTLYHLRHPLLGLDKLSAVCSGKIIIESQICDDYSAYHGFGHGYPSHHMVAEFFPTNELAGNHTNWWAPTLRCLAGLAIAAGFVVDVEAWKLVEKPNNIGLCRGFVSGRKAQK